jgi:RimJ/RimL family protein N-acetyltransferase
LSDRIEFPAAGITDGEILLRLLAEADLPALVGAVQDPEIPRWTRVPSPYGDPEARDWLRTQARMRESGEGLDLMIIDRREELVGGIGIPRFDREERSCELGYWLAVAARGRGVMTRAVRLLARWIFDNLPVDRIAILVDAENAPSRRVAERAGFTFEGVLRSHTIIKGTRRDMCSYSLIREDCGGV